MRHLSVCMLGLSAAIAAQVAAAQADSKESQIKEEIIVEGQYLYNDQMNALKTPTPIVDVPQSLSIISAEQIKLQGFTGVADIINYTPGVSNSQGEGHRDAVVFRGIRSTADFYLDGVRDDVQYYRPLYNLEQVEILRGPNALLFGRGGTGGILNRVTKKGVVGENFTDFGAAVDSFGEHSVQLDANLSASDSAAVRINAFYEGLDNHRDFYNGERIGVNPTAKFLLSDDTALDLSYEYVDHSRFIDRGIPTGADGRPVTELVDVVFGDADVNVTELTAHLLRASLQHDFSNNLKANASAFYGDYDKLYQNFYASDYDQANSPDVVTLDGYLDTTQRENLVLSANLIGQFDTGSVGHTMIGGVEYIDTSSNQDRYNAFWSTTQDDNEIFAIMRPLDLLGGVGVNASGLTTSNDFSVDINDDTHVNIESASIFIQDEIAISEKLDVILGARFDSFDLSVYNVVSDEPRSRKDEEVSPRAGIVYKPQENMSIYASYSESFLPRSGEQYANIDGDNDQLAPDVFENSEIGFKWDLANGLSFTSALFQNSQTTTERDNDTGETNETRGLEVEGIELQLDGQVTDQIAIRAGYSFLDGETKDGNAPRELPDHMASVWATYQASDKLGFGFGANYQGQTLIKDGGTQVLPSYTRFDAVAYYDVSDDLRIQLNAENLTDKEYFPNAHSTHQVTVGAPFNVRLGITGRF